MEQRYQAVMEVLGAHIPVTEVAERYGVSRQGGASMDPALSLGRHRGAAGPAHDATLEPPSPRPESGGGDLRDAAQPPALGTPDPGLLARTRRHRPGAGRDRPIYRVLVRNHLIVPVPRKRKRDSYVRWERGVSMELWQHDFISGVRLKPRPRAQGRHRHRRPFALLRAGQGGAPGQRAPDLPRLRPGHEHLWHPRRGTQR